MHTYLLITTDENTAVVAKLLKNLDATPIHYPVQTIEESREFKSFVKNGFGRKTALILPNFGKASIEAQNALLKVFEEPKKNVYFILTTSSLAQITETVQSRAQIIQDPHQVIPSKVQFLDKTTASLLSKTSKITKKEDALIFLLSLISESKERKPFSADTLEKCVNAYDAISGNGNIALHLTNLVVQIAKGS